MSKQYRDLTVGDLIDMGMNVSIHSHDSLSKKEAKQFLEDFDGVEIKEYLITVKGEKVEVIAGKTEDYTFEFHNYIQAKK